LAGSLKEIQRYRASVFNHIHEVVFHGKGGYDYDTVYNMPIWLRKFSFNKIKEWYDAEAEANKKASQGKQTNIDLNSPNKPNIPKQAFNPPTNKSFRKQNPNYVSKASKK
jgi:hypothetical protein